MNAAAPLTEAPPPDAAGQSAQYLTFMVGREAFAIGILAIKEIIEYDSLTEVPMMPECIRGVINLRGAVVPVMDLALRFGRPPGAVTKRTCIVIVEGSGEREDVGVIVDAVNAVVELAPAQIEPPPAFGASIRSQYLRGMGKIDGRFVILLDVGRVLDVAELLTARPTGDAGIAPDEDDSAG